ncbi:MAG: hypothetical protein O2856_14885, partial [Planctomycetota bacterium]|nr:hypothetical protein [Planctomycetota bacterium]
MTLSQQLRRSSFLFLVVFSAITLIGCGGGEEPATEADSAAASENPSSAPSSMPAVDPIPKGEGAESSAPGK